MGFQGGPAQFRQQLQHSSASSASEDSSSFTDDASLSVPSTPLGASQETASHVGIPAAYLPVLDHIEEEGWDSVENWSDGYTLLHWAAKGDRADLCQQLMGLRADP